MKQRIVQALFKLSLTKSVGSQLKKFGIVKFVPNSKEAYDEEREIQEAVKEMSLETRYY